MSLFVCVCVCVSVCVCVTDLGVSEYAAGSSSSSEGLYSENRLCQTTHRTIASSPGSHREPGTHCMCMH